MSETRRFAFFHESAPPPGGEGWESMYPYYLVPSAETAAEEDGRLWFADTMHWSRGCHPFGSIAAEAAYLGAGQNSTRIFALPTSLGLDVRVQHGYVYISPIPVTDPAEVERRAELFQDRAGYYYEHWDDLYARWKTKVAAVVADMRSVSFPPLPEFEPVEVVTEARGRSTAWEVIADFRRLVDDFFVVWQHHFEFLNLGYGGYIVFFQFCRDAFPEISEQVISRMVAGVDVLAFRPDDELRSLAALACELGVDGVLTAHATVDDVFAALARTAAGRTWLRAWDAAKDPWFDYFTEYGFTHDQDTWLTAPSVPLAGVARYAELLRAGEDVARPVARLRAERDEIVAEYRALLDEDEAARFDELLGLARRVFPYIEEHNIYIEHWAHAVFWRKAWELGDFLVSSGFARARDDVFFLNRFEVEQVLNDVVQSWAIGVPLRGAQRWATEIDRRRGIVAALQAAPPAPAHGTPPAEITDPFAIMNYGITTERVAAWLGEDEGGGDGSLSGIGGSPGTVEGPVRLLRSERDLGDLQPGEILVCAISAPSWGPAFSVAAGVVTDIGGMMSHAAIVCREYGLPAVVGTGFATARLRTGDRIRLDGVTGEVVLLAACADVDVAA